MFNNKTPIDKINQIVADFDKKVIELQEASEVARKESEHLIKKAELIKEEASQHAEAADKADRVATKFKELVA